MIENTNGDLMADSDEHRPNLLVMLAAIFAVIGAVVVYGGERGDSDANYAPALVLLGVGAFLILIMVIQASSRHSES